MFNTWGLFLHLEASGSEDLSMFPPFPFPDAMNVWYIYLQNPPKKYTLKCRCIDMPYIHSIWDLGGATRLLRFHPFVCCSCSYLGDGTFNFTKTSKKGGRNFVVKKHVIFFSPQLNYVLSRKSRSHISPFKEPALLLSLHDFPAPKLPFGWDRCFLVCGRRPWSLTEMKSTHVVIVG